MNIHKNFTLALNDFLESGEAMYYSDVMSDASEQWTVGTVQEISEISNNEPKNETIHALIMGNLSDKSIEIIMSDWQD